MLHTLIIYVFYVMIYMLVLNDIPIGNEEILDLLCEEIMKSSYDDETRLGNKVIVQFFRDAYEADKKLTNMVQEKISTDIIPIVNFEFCNWCDLNKFDFYAVSTDENKTVKKSQELLFYELCDICFGHLDGLFNRLTQTFSEE